MGFNINEIAVYDEEVHFKDKLKAGALSYIKRNYSMIDNSDICVFYYSENYVPKPNSNSGTKIAYNYAKRKKKILINLI
ncbi:MAG: hypothetical protein IJA97_04480 [Clostridia bacterium]|nr:hypothetical protein [Clostridia bacterium]